MLRNRNISFENTLLEALKKMDSLNKKLLIVLNNDKFIGLLSVGDIQRAIIQNKPLETKVSDVLRKNIRIASPLDEFNTIKKMMFDHRMELCPVVDTNNEIIGVYFWEDVFLNKELQPKEYFNLPVVILAGGLGTRLKPLTNVLPKPLIPLGDKTILEVIFDRFAIYGCNDYYVSVNYKADFIKYYIANQHLPFNIKYFSEEKPLGTAGSLFMLRGGINQTFFVSNCDIIIDQDYSEILNYHLENNNEITVVAALKHYMIPYGTIETGDNGILKVLNEKPELTLKINSGMYIMEPHLLDEIPDNQYYHITDLIKKVILRKGKAGVFPVSENSWKDIGEWDLFFKENKIRYK